MKAPKPLIFFSHHHHKGAVDDGVLQLGFDIGVIAKEVQARACSRRVAHQGQAIFGYAELTGFRPPPSGLPVSTVTMSAQMSFRP